MISMNRLMTHSRHRRDPLRNMLSPAEIAQLYGVTLRQVYYALDQRLLKSRRWGRSWLVDIRDLPDSWPTWR